MAPKRKKACAWSYSVGARGRNRVRVYDRGSKGIYVEFVECAEHGGKRVRLPLGTNDRTVAMSKAEALAVELRKTGTAAPAALTLRKLFEISEGVRKEKGASKRAHDERCVEMFCRYWGANRLVRTLSVTQWNQFISDRRRGAIAPAKAEKGRKVGNRVIEYDLRFLMSCLRLAVLTPNGKGSTWLGRNPFQGLPLPKEESPRRPTLSAEDYAKLLVVASTVHPDFKAMLVVAHETGHRMASVRQLRYSDIDFDRGLVTWRPEADKVGFAHTTPLAEDAQRILQDRQRAQVARQKAEGVISDGWVFPSDRKPSEPRSRSTVLKWWRKGCADAGLPGVTRRGPHALRRKFANELRDIPLKDLAHLGGWKSPQTILQCYQQPDEGTQREALQKRRTVRAVGE